MNKIDKDIETLVNLKDYYNHDTPSAETTEILNTLNDSISALKTILDMQTHKRGRKSIAHNVSRETFYEYTSKVGHYNCQGVLCDGCPYLVNVTGGSYCLSQAALRLMLRYNVERRNDK